MLLHFFLRFSAVVIAMALMFHTSADARPHVDGSIAPPVTEAQTPEDTAPVQLAGWGYYGRRGFYGGFYGGFGPGFYFGAPLYHSYPYYGYRRHYGYRHRRVRPYRYRSRVYRRGGGRCGYWRRQCIKNWGANNADFRGCMRYEGC